MKIALVNESSAAGLDFALLQAIAAAIGRQVNEQYAYLWQSGGCDVVAAESLSAATEGAAVVAVLDNADQANALGYHDTTPDGRPYGRVFASPILENGGTLTTGSLSISQTISHEVLEMVGDPYANWWADGPSGNEYALELCDPVENDSYEIDGIAVSNFVGPRFFSAGPGPYDWMGKLFTPFSMSAGGYLIVRSSSGDVHQIFGHEYAEWRKALKSHPAARTSRRHAR